MKYWYRLVQWLRRKKNNLPSKAGDAQETQIWPLGREEPLEEEMATHSSILAWKILWTEEPRRLQAMESQSRTRLSSWPCPQVQARAWMNLEDIKWKKATESLILWDSFSYKISFYVKYRVKTIEIANLWLPGGWVSGGWRMSVSCIPGFVLRRWRCFRTRDGGCTKPWMYQVPLNCSLLLLFSCLVMPDSFWPHGLQHARLPCSSLFPGVCLNSCSL